MATRYRGRNKTGPYATYQCDGPRSCVTRAMAPVDDLVERVVVRRLQEPDARALLTRNDAAARAARERVEAIEARLDLLQDDHDADRIDRRRYLRSMARHRAELDDAQREAVPRGPRCGAGAGGEPGRPMRAGPLGRAGRSGAAARPAGGDGRSGDHRSGAGWGGVQAGLGGDRGRRPVRRCGGGRQRALL